jgi:hypothetical protein
MALAMPPLEARRRRIAELNKIKNGISVKNKL